MKQLINSLRFYQKNSRILFVFFLCVGLFFGWLVWSYFDIFKTTHIHSLSNEECQSEYEFINPEPDCELYADKIEALSSLESVLNAYADHAIMSGKAKRLSIWFRDLKTRRFVGVNENETYRMASLLKVPIAIAYLKYAEVYPEVLTETFTYDGTLEYLYTKQYIVPQERLEKGREYEARELLERSIKYSDNVAAFLLYKNLPEGFVQKTIEGIGSAIPGFENTNEKILSARSYATMFRSLFNSSYLTREYSNYLLQILTTTTYSEGVKASLPTEVIVAHKFGEQTVESETGTLLFRQLHECGIVYADAGDEPYIFCILTEGKDFETLQTILKDIGRIMYESTVN